MKISLITVTYNSGKNITDCLQSVAEQTYSNIEYIIIDGGSTDGTLKYIKQNNFVNKIISEQDKGIYDAINKGIRVATGDIIGFLHSDDMLSSPNVLQNIVDAFVLNEADGVYGNILMVASENTNKNVRTWLSKPFHSKLLKYGWMPPHPVFFLKKSVYEKYGLFDLSYKISADYDFILRIFKGNNLKFVYIPETITKMRVGGASNGSLKKLIQKTIEDYKVLKMNNIPNPILALFSKKIRKIFQYF